MRPTPPLRATTRSVDVAEPTPANIASRSRIVGDTAPLEREGQLERRIKLLTGILAPTTVLTALLFYYGYVTTAAEYAYFGISMGSLGLSMQDVLLKSVAVLYVPLGVLFFCGLVAVWGHIWLIETGSSRLGARRVLRMGMVLATLGTVAFLRGVVGVFAHDVARTEPIALSPICLGLGICMMAYGRHLRRRVANAAPSGYADSWKESVGTVLVCGLIVLSLFWAANSFAAAYGRGRAVNLVEGLSRRPAVVLDTVDRLYIHYPGVTEGAIPGSEDRVFKYRYRGLRLLVEANGRLFLLPDQWDAADGATLVVRSDADIRLQFYR